MTQIKKPRAYFVLAIMLLSILIQLAEATTMQFTVPEGEEEIRSIKLAVEDHVLIEFTVVGQTDSTIDFYILDSHGNMEAEYSNLGTVSYSFICDEEGIYELHFSNRFASEDKLVTLNYEIQHYIFGIPQMLFLTIIIVFVCLGAVAAFVLMGKSR